MYTVREVGQHEGKDRDWINKVVFEINNVQNGHKLVEQVANHLGRVAFSTHEGGRYEICM